MNQKKSLREQRDFKWRRHWRARLTSWAATSLFALLLGGSIVAVAAFAHQAKAADLGGDCCADLEERVAELEATTARKGNRKVSLTVYGQVNTALIYFDPDIEGLDSDVTVADNQVSESRFGFKGEAKIREGVTAGFVLELGLDQKGVLDWASPSYDVVVRESYWFIRSDQLGKLSLGMQSTATDNLDALTTANRGSVVKLLSIDPVGSTYLGGLALPFDGGRDNVVRYDTPVLGGFMASAAWGGDSDDYDVALRYAGEFGQVKVAAGVGYRKGQTLDLGLVALPVDAETVSASGSIMHTPSGLFLDGMYSRINLQDVDIDVDAWHVLGGIETRLNDMGKTTFYGEYAQVEIDVNGVGTLDPSWYGLGIVQAVDAAAMDLYLTYRKYDLGIDAPGVGDPQQVVAGARIKF